MPIWTSVSFAFVEKGDTVRARHLRRLGLVLFEPATLVVVAADRHLLAVRVRRCHHAVVDLPPRDG